MEVIKLSDEMVQSIIPQEYLNNLTTIEWGGEGLTLSYSRGFFVSRYIDYHRLAYWARRWIVKNSGVVVMVKPSKVELIADGLHSYFHFAGKEAEYHHELSATFAATIRVWNETR